MRELTISRRSLLLLLLLAVLVVTSTIALPPLFQSGSVFAKPSAPTQTISPTLRNTNQANQADPVAGQNAAVAGAQAFYTVNYVDGQKTWLDRLCAVSTQLGCSVDQTLLGPALWPVFLQSQVATTVSVTIQNKIKDEVASTRGNAPMQVWQLSIHLSAPWPQQKPPQTDFTALALIIQENNVWKFERFLTDDELQVIK